jgi:hypothetical protein
MGAARREGEQSTIIYVFVFYIGTCVHMLDCVFGK